MPCYPCPSAGPEAGSLGTNHSCRLIGLTQATGCRLYTQGWRTGFWAILI